MRRLFYQSKLYDYSTRKEAEKHAEEMRAKGWFITESGIYENGQEEYPYSAEYHKQNS